MAALGMAHPSVGIIGSYQQSGDVVKWQGFRYPVADMPGREVSRRFMLGTQVFIEGQPLLGFGSPTSLMYRADLVRETDTFFPNSSPHADTSACYRSLQKSDFGFVYKILSYERIHPESQSSASLQLNRYFSQTLNDLLCYGSYYLSEKELKHYVKQALRDYHRFLALNCLDSSRGEQFWYYHESRLQELGYPLTKLALVKALLRTLLEESVNPAQALEKVQKRWMALQQASDAANTGVSGKQIPAANEKPQSIMNIAPTAGRT